MAVRRGRARLADGCRQLGTPVTAGNVSFYNQTGSTAILPTPIVGVLGLLADVGGRTPIGFQAPGDVIVLLGRPWTSSAGRSGVRGARAPRRHPPGVDLERSGPWAGPGRRSGLLRSAHDLSEGGLAQALVEAALRRGHGASVSLDGDPFVQLFSESTARALVSVGPGEEAAVRAWPAGTACRPSGWAR